MRHLSLHLWGIYAVAVVGGGIGWGAHGLWRWACLPFYFAAGWIIAKVEREAR